MYELEVHYELKIGANQKYVREGLIPDTLTEKVDKELCTQKRFNYQNRNKLMGSLLVIKKSDEYFQLYVDYKTGVNKAVKDKWYTKNEKNIRSFQQDLLKGVL